MGVAGCPDRAELQGFAIGSLPGPLFARVASHIEACADCEATLQALDRLADPLLSQLRRLDGTDDSEAEPVPEALIAAVRSNRPRCGAAAWFAADDCHHRLGKFELLDRLGAGSYGYVFRARDVELGRIVAIKVPRAGSLASEEDAAAVPARGPQRGPAQAPRHRRAPRDRPGRRRYVLSGRGVCPGDGRWPASSLAATGRSRSARPPSSSPRWPTHSTMPIATG